MENNPLKTFYSELLGEVRIYVEGNVIYFVAKDVCNCLGYTNSTRTIKRHVPNRHIQYRRMQTEGGEQEMVFVNESGLYRLAFAGKTKIAEDFQDWIADEVIPSIRLTGKYALPHWVSSQEEADEIQRMVDSYLDDSYARKAARMGVTFEEAKKIIRARWDSEEDKRNKSRKKNKKVKQE